MKKVGVFLTVLLLLASAAPTLWPQTTELRDARPGQEVTTMQSPGLELRLKGPGGTENARAVDPEGAFILNPFPYGYHDVRPPSTPQGVRGVAVSDTEVLVTFEASSDNVRVLGYDVYRDGARVGSTEIETYSDTGLAPMSTHGYQVIAKDRSGNASALSGTALATTQDSTTAGAAAQFIYEPYVRSVSNTQAVICFTANKTVAARIDYGPDAGYGISQSVANSADYAVVLTGLAPESLYHYRVVLDPSASATASTDRTLHTLLAADLTPPSFLRLPYVSYVSSTTALIAWQTDEESIGTVEYGQAAPGELSVSEAAYGVNHSVTVSGLSPGTVYYFWVWIADRFGNGPTWSPEDALVTLAAADTSPPLITVAPRVVSLSSDRALIGWTTNEPADSRVWFGTARGSYDRMTTSAVYATVRQVELVNLLPNTVYYYIVSSADTSGNLSAAGVERSFRTLATPDVTPPVLSRMTVISAEQQALVTWRSNTPADSLVAYGDSPGIYPYQKMDAALLTDHKLVLTGLEPDTLYYCQIASQDAAGNRRVSAEITFRTLPEGRSDPPVISGLSLTSTVPRITISWLTTTNTTTELQYRNAADTSWTVQTQTRLVTSHVTALIRKNLARGTYYYRVAGTDRYGQRVEVSLDASGQPLQFVVP